MRVAIIALCLILPMNTTQPLDFSKLFGPQKKKVVKKELPKKVVHHRKSKAIATPTRKTFTVDADWMARYWTLVALWDYPIPEEKDIRYENGKYIVPAVVFRHYEDMAATPVKAQNNE